MVEFIVTNQFFILLAFIAVGFGIVGFFLQKICKKIKILFGGGEKTGQEFSENIVSRVTDIESRLSEMQPRLDRADFLSHTSIQKVGFLRFNPFRDTGGDNSFVVALLDQNNDGVLLSSLYMREGVRVYAKRIERGQTKHHLTAEETRVLEDTIKKT